MWGMFMNKKIALITVAIVCTAGLILFNTVNKPKSDDVVNESNYKKDTPAIEHNLTNKKDKTVKKQDKSFKAGIQQTDSLKPEKSNSNIIKADLYNDTPSSALPLSAITEISTLPENVREIVVNISRDNNIYLVQKHNNKLLIISDNPENIRHGIDFTEVTISNGHQIKTTLGYNDKMKDSRNDVWAYKPDTNQPVKHMKYNDEGDIEFVEEWNYEPENPVKYEMKDSEGKVISIKKETLSNGTDLRVEHLIYDKDGKTKVNVSATYEGDDIKRFTYYNADKINESASVFSDYSEGVKTKETVYTSDLKVKNTYISDYNEGNREDIIIYDNKNQEIKKYLPEKSE